MDCTGGFKALREHVAAAKRVHLPHHFTSDERANNEIEIELRLEDDIAQAQKSIRYNQERLWKEEKRINALRLVVTKEQRDAKERERSARAMERAAEEAKMIISEKETNLDKRIEVITRLEARLHEAITTQQQQQSSPLVSSPAPEEHDCNECRAALEQREKELIMARERVADREKHLATKERLLRDKAAELSELRLDLERKDALRQQQLAEQTSAMENELKESSMKRLGVLKNDLLSRFDCETAALKCERQELLEARHSIETAKCALEQTERSLFLRTAELTAFQQQLQVSKEQQMMREEDVSAHCEIMLTNMGFLKEHRDRLDQQQRSQEQAEAALRLRERNLALFAEQVEAQHQSNKLSERELSNEKLRLYQLQQQQQLQAVTAGAAVATAFLAESKADSASDSGKTTSAKLRRSGSSSLRSK